MDNKKGSRIITIKEFMTEFDKINNCQNLFLTKLYEPNQNQLMIEVCLGYVSEREEEIYVSNVHIGLGRQIIFDNYSNKYRIYFDSYISYFVLNESFDKGMIGEYSGNRIREYKQSAFIDFCRKETSGFAIIGESTIKHFVFVTQNHIVNVLTKNSLDIQSIN
ncbi:MAG: hypothetical protein M3R72_05820 [Bacteroidota bacterium]|nr:hypothetical protein [Bacteroidota bacterium]